VLAQASGTQTIRPLLWQAGMKPSEGGEVTVFRRFPAALEDEMRVFYNEVLGLDVLPSTALGGGAMIRYPVGASEVKLFPVNDAEPNTATVASAIGVRLLTFFFDDQAAVSQRFAKHGIEPPAFLPTPRSGASAAALAQDPAGEWVELVVVSNASAEQLARFEIGVAAANVEKSREFYRSVLGLEEHAPVRDDLLGTERRAFTHGSTTINVFDVEPGLPNRSQTAGMQYIVWSASAVNDVAQARGASIDRPLSAPGQMRTIWLADPDGVSNYFAEFAGNDNTPPR
jgi:catechol 2,3-dioxygenase-like lactoylglutathione lyase family enzyme